MRCADRLLPGFLILASSGISFLSAQTPAARRTVWDGAYTEAQATRGTPAYSQRCAGCHALANEGKAPLVGDPFWKSFSQKSVGELLAFVSTYMPNGAPGSLEESAYADIVAVMLKANGFPAGTTELSRTSGADAQILPRDGRTALPANALVRVVGCLARDGSSWVVTRATSPERAERTRPPAEDASRPLGSRTMPLKFVLTRLDSMAGARVLVNGILMGDDGVDGLNVTTVSRISPACP